MVTNRQVACLRSLPFQLHVQFGANLAVDGKAETFTGPQSDKANPMLSRDYRTGFVVPAAGQA